MKPAGISVFEYGSVIVIGFRNTIPCGPNRNACASGLMFVIPGSSGATCLVGSGRTVRRTSLSTAPAGMSSVTPANDSDAGWPALTVTP